MPNSGYYLFKEDVFNQNIEDIKNAFNSQHFDFTLGYSIKANYNELLIKSAYDKGVHFDCASLDEIKRLKELHVPSHAMWVNTSHLTNDLLDCLDKEGIFMFADSFLQLEQLKEFCTADQKVTVGVRICLQQHKSRFGIEASNENIAQLHSFFKEHKNIELKGLSIHYSTADRSISKFRSRVEEFVQLYANFFQDFTIDTLNFGGGFAGNMSLELAAQFEYTIPTWEEYAKVIKTTFAKNNIPHLKVLIEPGIALAADSFDFIAEVIDIKYNGGQHIALLNTSTLFLKPTGHSKDISFDIENPSTEKGVEKEYLLAGMSCMETDTLGVYKGHLQPGSRLRFKNVGSYTLSFRENFIFDQPEVIPLRVLDLQNTN
ncbi:alanine racemase [Pseudotenacibaculum haliotis]|uniref:Alanine racemase n=1 Tax=Pseudotenacibaculum haliotis TaxID=1862138 RepID=A0ABW5LTU6_9FLAO